MSEEKVKELTKDIQRRIKSTNRWLSANKSIGNPEGEAFRQIEIYELALAALTQPASPALKLPDGWVAVPREPNWEMLSADGCKEHHNGQACLHHDNRRRIWSAMLSSAPFAPHTAPIEPICATGGAEWVKPVPSELQQVLLELRTYNPKADEYGGKHIIPGWADRIEKALGIKPAAPEEE